MLSDNFAYPGLMKYFEEISAIPRASYKEGRIADYICGFAEKRGLEYYRDKTDNVLVNLPASEGYGNAEPILLQGHTDMVCEKNEGAVHDFDSDGLELYEENGWIRAKGTTLGADDGVAVAVMLYVLDGGVSKHGAVQCLFTASEEVGLDGAKAFDYSRIFAKRMINMDSADETQLIAGCAGGQRSSLKLAVSREEIHCSALVRVCISGLCGGHSGEDIDKGRANANKLMGRLLYETADENTRIVDIAGGTKDNAIPRECTAVLAVNDLDALSQRLSVLEEALKKGMCADDAAFELRLEKISENTETAAIDLCSAKKAVFLIHTVPNGVFEMNHGVEGIVEWSRNLGIVGTDESSVELVFSSRSSFEERIDASAAELDDFAKITGAEVRHYNRYPGWSFAPVSPLREAYIRASREVLGVTPEVTVIHAGLECGLISGAIPDMDIISCGPVTLGLHSPDERLDKRSFERFFTVVKRVIEQK